MTNATMLIMKVTVFRDDAPCSLVEVYRSFRGVYCLHHQGDVKLIANVTYDQMILRIMFSELESNR
jgi:hypothetical protein